MNRPISRVVILLVLALVLMVVLVGCGGSNEQAAPQNSNEQRQQQWTKPEPVENQVPVPMTSGKTVAEVMASISDSIFLDATHIKKGLDCATCHGELPGEGAPAIPMPEKCLSCHNGSLEELSKTTDFHGEENPHRPHDGELSCDTCHKSHQPFENYCDSCHSFGLGQRFN